MKWNYWTNLFQPTRKKMEDNKCFKKDCNGGKAFNIREKMFCSPRCGNIHFNLERDDEDYWENDEQDEEEKQNELWIDLQSLIRCSGYRSGLKTVFCQYNENHKQPADDTYHYCLRKALRAVGHKITFIRHCYDHNDNCVQVEYQTTITEAEDDRASLLWNEYVRENMDH